MLESRLVFFIINVIGIVGEAGWSFPLRGRKAVLANPLHNYRYQPQLYRNPMSSGYHQNYGARALHSNAHHQDIISRSQPSQYITMKYDVIVYGKDNIRPDELFSILNILSNHELRKSSKIRHPSTSIHEGANKNNGHNRPAAEQYILNLKNVTVQPLPQRVTKIQGQEDSPTTQDQTSDYSTTEPIAILGMPLVVPISDVNSEEMDSSMRLEILMEKQCVQDCQSSTSYSPVCGSDNVTYFNVEKFLCAQKCGVDVLVTKNGPCN